MAPESKQNLKSIGAVIGAAIVAVISGLNYNQSKENFDKAVETQVEIRTMKLQLQGYVDIPKTVQDHETRLRVIEKEGQQYVLRQGRPANNSDN